ncbi:hypothetical protein Tco_1002158 [Tanacetum coccineum]|uniref:Uncharacterized protein n=1 Tax=Tanacetum coccineum TaxID=301880 RepID=A0ABQ5F5V2_9ASTR
MTGSSGRSASGSISDSLSDDLRRKLQATSYDIWSGTTITSALVSDRITSKCDDLKLSPVESEEIEIVEWDIVM